MIQESRLEKLKSKIRIDLIFKKGKAVRSGALVMHFILPKVEVKNTHIGVSVTKRSVLLACRRNRIKRQIRAVIQQQKEKISQTLPPGFYMVLYKGKVDVSSESLSEDFRGVLRHFTELN